MNLDFTLTAYERILKAGQSADYAFGTVDDLFEGRLTPPFIVLRHDVDRRAPNALEMAKLEARYNLRASYYFRMVKASFVPDIITDIRDMNHEIGYHYEDWHTAKYDPAHAKTLFDAHLKRLRKLAPIRTICMHGSPLSRENNMTVWEHLDYTDYGVKDCILSQDYSGYAFFTDSGRTFGVSGANLRDELGNADIFADVRSTSGLCAFLKAQRANKVMISCHPERWTDKPLIWTHQFAKDQAVNVIKRGLKLLR